VAGRRRVQVGSRCVLPNIVEEVGLGVVVRSSPSRLVCTEVDIFISARHLRYIYCWGFDEHNIPAFNDSPSLGVPQSPTFAAEGITHHGSLVRLSRKLLGMYF
ncbi:unnamed protein product, partial [Sphacelaria rigidula]